MKTTKTNHNMSSYEMVINANPTVCRFRVVFYGPAQAQKTSHYMDGTLAQVSAWADREGAANGYTEWVIRKDAVRIVL